MTTLKYIGRHALALVASALFVACSSGGTDNSNPGTISLSLNPSSGSAQQNGQAIVVATLTRGGGFTGTVNLTVTGVPTGVTATVSNIVTTGATTTATVTIAVAQATAVGVYPLVVHGTGSGVTEATSTYTLTVVASPESSYTLALSASAVTILQGASTPTITVTMARTNFDGRPITLSVDNLPAGVTAAFSPINNQSGTSAVLTLTVAADAPLGTFTNLLVRGTTLIQDDLVDRTVPLTLTIAAPAPSFTLSLTNASLTIPQGSSAPTTTVNIARVNFPGDVALSVLNLPTGVTAAFAPANPQSGTSSVLTLAVAPGAPTGVFNNLSVQGVGTPGTVATPLSLTITTGVPAGNFTLTSTPPTSGSVTQGAQTNVTVNLNRTGGNVSDVALTLTGTLPTGLTFEFNPNHTTGNSSVLTFTSTGSAAVGAYPVVIHGNTAGLGEQLANFTINVVAPAGSGNATVSFVGCALKDKPVWAAFLDGTSGTWTQITGAADLYNFNITQSKGSFAYVSLQGGAAFINVQNMTQSEWSAGTQKFCPIPTPTGKGIHGTVVNAAFGARLSFGGQPAGLAVPGPFTIVNVPPGTFDLFGWAGQAGGTSSPDRAFILRGENPASGGSFSVPANFSDPVRSAAAVTASATVTGLTGGSSEAASYTMSFSSAAACAPGFLFPGTITGPTFNLSGIPASLLVPGDLHIMTFSTVENNGSQTFRVATESFGDVATRAATPFVLPPFVPVGVASDAGGPYKRPTVVTTGMPAVYDFSHQLIYFDNTTTAHQGFLTSSQAYVGGSTVTLSLPNFHGVGTFQDSWGPGTSDHVTVTVNSVGGVQGNLCTPGQRMVNGYRSGTI